MKWSPARLHELARTANIARDDANKIIELLTLIAEEFSYQELEWFYYRLTRYIHQIKTGDPDSTIDKKRGEALIQFYLDSPCPLNGGLEVLRPLVRDWGLSESDWSKLAQKLACFAALVVERQRKEIEKEMLVPALRAFGQANPSSNDSISMYFPRRFPEFRANFSLIERDTTL